MSQTGKLSGRKKPLGLFPSSTGLSDPSPKQPREGHCSRFWVEKGANKTAVWYRCRKCGTELIKYKKNQTEFADDRDGQVRFLDLELPVSPLQDCPNPARAQLPVQ